MAQGQVTSHELPNGKAAGRSCHAHHMIDAEGVHPAELQAPGKGVANDGGAQVPHMHLLGRIGR